MENKNIAKLIVLKIICCGALVFFLLGGIGLLAGLSTSNIMLSGIGIAVLLWATYKVSVVTMDKYKND